MRLGFRLALPYLLACEVNQRTPPIIEAHRGGAAAFPENSAAAFENSFANGVKSVEFDVVVTLDGVPILHHDAWLSPDKCTYANGEALDPANRLLIAKHNWQDIRNRFVCGGIPQDEFPNAEVLAKPILSLAEFLEIAEGYPEVRLHYDIKFEPHFSVDANTMAEQIVNVINERDVLNPQYMTAFQPEMLNSLKERTDIELSLDWPLFTEHLDPTSSDTITALRAEYAATTGLVDYVSATRKAGAAGIGVPYQIIDWHQVNAAQYADLNVQVWTLNTPALLNQYCDWPVDFIITDIPEAAPCFSY